MKRKAKRLRRAFNLRCHFAIALGGGRVAGGVIMDKDQRRSVEFQSAFDDLARIDRHVVDRAFCLRLVRNEDVLTVEEKSTRNCSVSR